MEPAFGTPVNPAVSLIIPTEIYARQANLEAALEEAAKTSSMDNCVPSERFPVTHSRRFPGGVAFGGTDFRQLGWTEDFEVSLTGEFFTNLRILPTPGGVEFRRNNELATKIAGSLTLTVRPVIRKEPHWMGSSASMVTGGWRFTDALKDMRFHVLWAGSKPRDLGEIPATLETSSYRKGFPLEGAYTMDVPAEDIPITDNLEVHILSPAGVQLGCMSGHL
jgi:hypothetical protein